jgi:RNA polymerase sigma factor (TIGR02999 family)
MAHDRGEVTGLLAEVALGRSDALDRLMPLVYGELRRIARNQMRGERPGHTLQPTVLVHEAFLRLVDQSRADWRNRAQFFGVAAQLMRRLLVDHARRRCAGKRGIPVTLNEGICQRGAEPTKAKKSWRYTRPWGGWRNWIRDRPAWWSCAISAGYRLKKQPRPSGSRRAQ